MFPSLDCKLVEKPTKQQSPPNGNVVVAHHSAQERHNIQTNAHVSVLSTNSINNSSRISPSLISCYSTKSSGTDHDSITDLHNPHDDMDWLFSSTLTTEGTRVQEDDRSRQKLPQWTSRLFSGSMEEGRILKNSPTTLKSSGLADIPEVQLMTSVEPILEQLRALNAEELLGLERIQNFTTSLSGEAAVVDHGVFVHPIHELVQPPTTAEQGKAVRYVHVDEVPEQYSMGIFIFPPYAKIPLHDHPGMCVLSRILYGEVQRLSLDLPIASSSLSSSSELNSSNFPTLTSWTSKRGSSRDMVLENNCTNTRQDNPPHPRAKVAYQSKPVEILQAPAVTSLYPCEGNLHEFVAGPNGAAVLDVLLPPYDADRERDCTFYNIVERSSSISTNLEDGRTKRCWIVPTGQPEDFHCISGRYHSMGAN